MGTMKINKLESIFVVLNPGGSTVQLEEMCGKDWKIPCPSLAACANDDDNDHDARHKDMIT